MLATILRWMWTGETTRSRLAKQEAAEAAADFARRKAECERWIATGEYVWWRHASPDHLAIVQVDHQEEACPYHRTTEPDRPEED